MAESVDFSSLSNDNELFDDYAFDTDVRVKIISTKVK